jgi:glycyl-tRNA synthetase alpha chain
MTFQELILALQGYWAAQGCVLAQAYDVEVGAGTMAPTTFLRALGPEPWNVAYVQPSRRPADGRFGENPNRLFQHHQFQVLLKPAPKNVQELYLGSLKAIGIDPLEHDIRFVEDDWEAPPSVPGGWAGKCGATGWRSPSSLTSSSVVASSAGRSPPSSPTAGADRHVPPERGSIDVTWVKGVTYGEVFTARGGDERYAFHASDRRRSFPSSTPTRRNACGSWAWGCPAGHEAALKCSHTFNLLDARGRSASPSGRGSSSGCDNARASPTYLRTRARLGFPLVKTGWAVGEQLPPLEGTRASASWATLTGR